jgi:hypothetical protein
MKGSIKLKFYEDEKIIKKILFIQTSGAFFMICFAVLSFLTFVGGIMKSYTGIIILLYLSGVLEASLIIVVQILFKEVQMK